MITRVGPMIIFQAPSGETMVTLQIVWRQDGCSTAIITRWDIDSDASSERHMNKTWDQYWELVPGHDSRRVGCRSSPL